MSEAPEGILHITVRPDSTSSSSNMGIAQQLLAMETVRKKLMELYTSGAPAGAVKRTLGPGPGFVPRKLP